MRLFSLLVLVVGACTKTSSVPAPEVPSNAATPAGTNAEGPVTNEPLPLGPAGSCAVGGVVVTTETNEPLAGVTIVLAGAGITDGKALISDEHGRFLLHAPEVPERIDVYYMEQHHDIAYTALACGRALKVAFAEN